MSVDVDYYELLGVERTADDKMIKSSFRRLAMECHPDRNPGCKDSEAKFKAINEAYDCLKDPQKRAAYDRFGKAAFQNGGFGQSSQGFDGFSDIFENIFGEFMGGGRAVAAVSASNAAPTCATISRSRWRKPIPVRRRRSRSMSR